MKDLLSLYEEKIKNKNNEDTLDNQSSKQSDLPTKKKKKDRLEKTLNDKTKKKTYLFKVAKFTEGNMFGDNDIILM
jgi:hypothetical protein